MADTIELADGRRLAYAEYGDPASRPILYFQHAARAISGAELTICGGEGHILAGRFPEIASCLARS